MFQELFTEECQAATELVKLEQLLSDLVPLKRGVLCYYSTMNRLENCIGNYASYKNVPLTKVEVTTVAENFMSARQFGNDKIWERVHVSLLEGFERFIDMIKIFNEENKKQDGTFENGKC
jgi:hypothetical protein